MKDRNSSRTGKSEQWPASDQEIPTIPELSGWMSHRRSIHKFDPDGEVPDEVIRTIIDAGRHAPTSGSIQMYSFIWIREPERRQRIQDLCSGSQPQVTESSHFLLVCIDLRRVRLLHEHRGLEFELSPMCGLLKGGVDASLAGQSAMIAAESRGLGVCPVGSIGENLSEIVDLVDIPRGVLPIWGLSIGIPLPDEEHQSTPRIPLDAVLHDETYTDPSETLLEECYEAMDEQYSPESGRSWDGLLANYWSPRPDGYMNNREEELRRAMEKQGFFAYRGIQQSRSER